MRSTSELMSRAEGVDRRISLPAGAHRPLAARCTPCACLPAAATLAALLGPRKSARRGSSCRGVQASKLLTRPSQVAARLPRLHFRCFFFNGALSSSLLPALVVIMQACALSRHAPPFFPPSAGCLVPNTPVRPCARCPVPKAGCRGRAAVPCSFPRLLLPSGRPATAALPYYFMGHATAPPTTPPPAPHT